MSEPFTETETIEVEARCLCRANHCHIRGESFGIIYCHCRRCQKHHGSVAVPFVILKSAIVDWDQPPRLGHYQSELTERAFCETCGASFPRLPGGEVTGIGLPAGAITDMAPPLATWHLFTSTMVSWYRVPEGVEASPGVGRGFEDQDPHLPELDRYVEPGKLTGSCLCGSVSYVAEPAERVMNCHCTRCRYSRGAAHATNVFVGRDRFAWRSGKDSVTHYRLPDAERFGVAFCRHCGSLVPRAGESRVSIPAGSLDVEPHIDPAGHIFTGSMARWHTIADDLPQWQARPH